MEPETLGIGGAVSALQAGNKVARKNWNGKGMFLFLKKSYTYRACDAIEHGCADINDIVHMSSSVWMKTANGQVVPWLCSQTDLLANDWVIVE